MSELPVQPWQEVSVDFAEPSSDECLLVISDDYSRYPVVEVLHSLTTLAVVPPSSAYQKFSKLTTASQFESFASNLGFAHRKITPHWARANGEVERFMRTVKKVIKIALMEQKP